MKFITFVYLVLLFLVLWNRTDAKR
jgi:hypothetical protein